jgi:hypothetical protein
LNDINTLHLVDFKLFPLLSLVWRPHNSYSLGIVLSLFYANGQEKLRILTANKIYSLLAEAGWLVTCAPAKVGFVNVSSHS